MILYRWICWLRTIWYVMWHLPTLTGPYAAAFVSGHSFVTTDDMNVLARVDVLRCEDCDTTSVGWKRVDRGSGNPAL